MTKTLRSSIKGALNSSIKPGLLAPAQFRGSTLDLDFAGAKSLKNQIGRQDVVSFTRASSATYVDGDGIIQSATTNTPRFDYDPATGESLGLLIEEARTNLVTYSEEFDQWTVGINATVTPNAAIAPDGTLTAERVVFPATSGTFVSNGTVTAGTTFTASVYAKAVTPGTNDTFTFNLGGGPHNASSQFTTTDQWQRFTFTLTPSDLSGNPSLIINNEGDGFASDVYLWGAQLEEASFSTSYIPTSGSTVTRAADVAEITGTNFSSFYNQTEGTFFGDVTGPAGFGFVAHAGSNDNRHGFGTASGRPFTTIAGISTNFGVSPTLVAGGGKVAYGYKANDYGAFGDGVNLPATSPTSVPTGVNEFAIGYRGSFSPNAFLNGHVKRLAYFPVRLPDATLQNITS